MIQAAFSYLYTLFVLPPIAYLLCISIAGLRNPRKPKERTPAKGKMCVLVPAHNEKLTIKRTLESLLEATTASEDIDIVVIADNCSDNTATIAQQFPVTVLERTNKNLRGKGAALQWAMAQLKDKEYDFTAIIDADGMVNREFFHELRISLNNPQCQAVQSYNVALPNDYSGIKRLAMLGFNVLRARGRVALGGSAGILGNGFVLSRSVLEKVPFRANSIVEDLEYHMRLIESDIKVHFCGEARIHSEMPNDAAASNIQSSRWEGGRIGVLRAAWWPLLRKSIRDVFHGKLHSLDALLDLMLLPIGYMVFILFIGLISPSTQWITALGFFTIGIYVLGAAKCGNGWSELSVLKRLPIFLWYKLARISKLFASSSSKTQWKRTPRGDKEK